MDQLNEKKIVFVTNDEKVKSVIQDVPKFALADIPVLILGESGTGKEIIANFIHVMSRRKEKPFIAVNCAAIPAELLESELFGHKKGAFTGANNDHCGLFEMAEGGTLFLDEIGDMPLLLQAKLLRIIQDKKIRRVGESHERHINFRIVSATHRSLKDEIRAGRFREDLFYRLCGCSFHLPALRERPGDIRLLIHHFSSLISKKYATATPEFSEKALKKLDSYSWPGNVRQLENVVEQMALRSQGEIIDDDLLGDVLSLEDNRKDECFCNCKNLPTLAELSERYIHFISKKVNHHQGSAAKILGISRRTLYRKTMGGFLNREPVSIRKFPNETKKPIQHH